MDVLLIVKEHMYKVQQKGMHTQRTVGGKDRKLDDDGGHLIGAQFKGPKDIDNLVPLNSQINRSGGEWFNMETEWANALKETPPKKLLCKLILYILVIQCDQIHLK